MHVSCITYCFNHAMRRVEKLRKEHEDVPNTQYRQGTHIPIYRNSYTYRITNLACWLHITWLVNLYNISRYGVVRIFKNHLLSWNVGFYYFNQEYTCWINVIVIIIHYYVYNKTMECCNYFKYKLIEYITDVCKYRSV